MASRNQTLFTTAASRSTSWLITTRPPSCLQEPAQPGDGVGVEVVRGLVEQQHRRARCRPPPPSEAANRIRASSTRRRWPPERVSSSGSSTRSGRPRLRADPRGFALGGVPAERGEPLLDAAVLADGLVLVAVDEFGHLVCAFSMSRSSWSRPRAESTRSFAVTVQVALARVLRQVADSARSGDRSRRTARPRPRAPAAWWSCRRRCGRRGRYGRRAARAGWRRPAGCGTRHAVPGRSR